MRRGSLFYHETVHLYNKYVPGFSCRKDHDLVAHVLVSQELPSHVASFSVNFLSRYLRDICFQKIAEQRPDEYLELATSASMLDRDPIDISEDF